MMDLRKSRIIVYVFVLFGFTFPGTGPFKLVAGGKVEKTIQLLSQTTGNGRANVGVGWMLKVDGSLAVRFQILYQK